MPKKAQELCIHFDQLTAAKANVAARELQREIRRVTGGNIQSELRRETDDTQDIARSLLSFSELRRPFGLLPKSPKG